MSGRRHFVLHLLAFVGVAALVYVLLAVLVQMAAVSANVQLVHR